MAPDGYFSGMVKGANTYHGLIAAVATAVIAVVAGLQWCTLERTDETLRTGQRAYLIVDSVTVEKFSPGELLVSFVAENSGPSPVYNMRTEMAIDLREYPLASDIPMQALLAPDAAYFARIAEPREIRSKAFTEDQIAEILKASERRLYVVAKITYRDIFQAVHHTNFCFMYTKTRTRGMQFVRCDDLSGVKLNYAD